MEKFRQPINYLLPGTLVAFLIATIIFGALIALWVFAYQNSEGGIYLNHYLQMVLIFTLLQAFWSTIISLILAVIVAKSLDLLRFDGKSLLLSFYSVTFALPSLVVVTGLFSVYGSAGIIAHLFNYFGYQYPFSLYGWTGILMAHVFFNFPYASKVYYQALQMIPNEQKKLAEQLNFNLWQSFKYLELPIIAKQLLPVGGLNFMFCFASFATVLTLSGGPKYTTIEVAIYQAIRDFELSQAVVLSLIQLLFCIGFMILLRCLVPKQSPQFTVNHEVYHSKVSILKKSVAVLIIGLSTLYIIMPLIALLIDTIVNFSVTFLTPTLIQSTITSLMIAGCSAILAMTLAIAILWTNSRLCLMGNITLSNYLMFLGSLILAIPNMVLSVGFFLLFFSFVDTFGVIFILVVISNALLALPFILRNLSVPLNDITQRYHLLASSLNITGLNYLYLIEYRALKRLFGYSFAFAYVISMGDFGIIALFGNQDFMTLPYYLFELVSNYRYQEASFSSLILLIISFLLINLFENTHND